MTLAASLVRRGAAAFAERTALVFGDDSLTYAEVDRRANLIAHHLAGHGVGKGTHVALLVSNGLDSIPMEFAAIKAGLVRVPLNARLSLDEHADMVTGSHATVVVADAALAARADELAARIPGLRAYALADLLAPVAEPVGEPDVVLSEDDPSLLLYTSGTTGKLKAVVHTQGSYAAICSNILANLLDPQPDSVMLHAASLIHASGTFVLPYWVRGGASAILPGFEPASFAAAIARHRATEINLVPTMFAMLHGSGALDGADLSSLRKVIYGASPMPRPVLERSIEVFGPILTQYYGQTEAPLCIAVLDQHAHADPTLWGACGMPATDVELRLVDEDGAEVPAGEIGEIALKAPFRMQGYFEADELNARSLTGDGWLRTRDLARFDERGYLHLVDRTSDMIITGGYNVYPREVEDALAAHPAVAECAVVGAPDEKWIEAVTAFVTLRPGATADEPELIEHVRARIAAHKAPKSVHFVDAIPKSAVGKILRRALRQPLWEETR
ncbi:AMP-binding protein [Pimelobacter simplex]|uniref:Long-chain-fatty-acid--CoA ligase n=3 Tax=Nocardioides simplex TaxID=2045 RepID=A0A0A1DH06_NOCSI|nr:AMP-binding protein [Pimelobacter simplex]AIY16611.1 Long-chain-fatty-acid--CoA ligase [Pimelobacter simplex]GEB15425.1 ligase [Pimelobacter simplex]SFN14932.1 Acyl-CoA synthetase (AMP-forming)/AMP-acid ligase II [Pimelobacter simplex]